MYQPSASGRASSRSVSAVGAQSTTITSHSPERACSRSSSSASTSSAPGMTVSSSAATGSTPGDVEDRQQVALDLGPRLLEPQLGVDLLHVEALGDLGGLGADADAERVGERVGGVGGQHERAVAGGRGERRGAGRDGGLADPALAGEEQDSCTSAQLATRRAS